MSMPSPGHPCIITLHPQGKNGAHISLQRYEQTCRAIQDVLQSQLSWVRNPNPAPGADLYPHLHANFDQES